MSEQPLWQRYQSHIDALAALPINFDLARRAEYTEANSWHIDHYTAELPPEPRGAPLAGGSWAAAQTMMREYRFPDPSIVTGIFYPDRPLEQRVMLLRARAFGITFFFGVRIGGVVDEVRQSAEGPQQVWGFNYQTLKGHYERGQMDFSVIKWRESGKVAFHIDAFSQAAEIPNPIIRLGFHLFGRCVQVRFAKRALARMQQLVKEELAGTHPSDSSQPAAPPVLPTSAEPTAANKLERAVNND